MIPVSASAYVHIIVIQRRQSCLTIVKTSHQQNTPDSGKQQLKDFLILDLALTSPVQDSLFPYSFPIRICKPQSSIQSYYNDTSKQLSKFLLLKIFFLQPNYNQCITLLYDLFLSESVDSLCRDGADAQYLSKSRITSPQIR